MGYLQVAILVTLVLEGLASPSKAGLRQGRRRRQSQNEGRIMGGEPVTDIDEYGYMASIRATRINLEILTCSGFILTEDTLGTAAFCVYSVDPYTMDVRVGSTDVDTAIAVTIKEILINPPYDPSKPEIGGNFALLKSDDYLPYDTNVHNVFFPPYMYKLPDAGTMVTVLGWGQTKAGIDEPMSKTLMKVDIPIVSSAQCSASYFFMVADGEFCAGTMMGGKGPCEFDMGGPAIYDEYIVGVVSDGRGCGSPVSPSIFTSIFDDEVNRFILFHTDIITK